MRKGKSLSCVASVSLSAMGVSSDDQSGRGWVENDIGREGRWRKREARFNLCLDNAALSRQIIIHEPIYIIPCTGALSYHSCALKYRSLSSPLSLPLVVSKEAPMFMRSAKRYCGSSHRLNASTMPDCFAKYLSDARRVPTLPVRPIQRYAKFEIIGILEFVFLPKN